MRKPSMAQLKAANELFFNPNNTRLFGTSSMVLEPIGEGWELHLSNCHRNSDGSEFWMYPVYSIDEKTLSLIWDRELGQNTG